MARLPVAVDSCRCAPPDHRHLGQPLRKRRDTPRSGCPQPLARLAGFAAHPPTCPPPRRRFPSLPLEDSFLLVSSSGLGAVWAALGRRAEAVERHLPPSQSTTLAMAEAVHAAVVKWAAKSVHMSTAASRSTTLPGAPRPYPCTVQNPPPCAESRQVRPGEGSGAVAGGGPGVEHLGGDFGEVVVLGAGLGVDGGDVH